MVGYPPLLGLGRGETLCLVFLQQGWHHVTDSCNTRGGVNTWHHSTALCRIKLLPVTHVLVDTWLLTVKLVYGFSSVPDDLKWATNTHMTPFHLHSLSRHNWQYLWFWKTFFLLLHFLPCPPIFLPVNNGFYPHKWRVGGSLHKAVCCSKMFLMWEWTIVEKCHLSYFKYSVMFCSMTL